MAVKGQFLLTMGDVAKIKGAKEAKVAEVLLKHNPILRDLIMMEMNEGTYHKEFIRSSLPEIYYRKANQAIPSGKSQIEERTFNGAHFESKSQIDKAVAERGGRDRLNFNRWNQGQGHLQAMTNEQASLLIYGSPEGDNRKTPGFMDVYSTVSTATSPTAKNVLDCGGTGSDNTSILLISHGPNSTFGIFPKETTGGIKRTDKTPTFGQYVQILGTDENGNPGTYDGYEEQFEIDHGLVVKDYRQSVRAANIDVSDLVAGSGIDLIEVMIDMLYKQDSWEAGTSIFNVNRTLAANLDKQSNTKVGAAGGLKYEDYQGMPILTFRKRPIRVVDAILDTEARVV